MNVSLARCCASRPSWIDSTCGARIVAAANSTSPSSPSSDSLGSKSRWVAAINSTSPHLSDSLSPPESSTTTVIVSSCSLLVSSAGVFIANVVESGDTGAITGATNNASAAGGGICGEV